MIPLTLETLAFSTAVGFIILIIGFAVEGALGAFIHFLAVAWAGLWITFVSHLPASIIQSITFNNGVFVWQTISNQPLIMVYPFIGFIGLVGIMFSMLDVLKSGREFAMPYAFFQTEIKFSTIAERVKRSTRNKRGSL